MKFSKPLVKQKFSRENLVVYSLLCPTDKFCFCDEDYNDEAEVLFVLLTSFMDKRKIVTREVEKEGEQTEQVYVLFPRSKW